MSKLLKFVLEQQKAFIIELDGKFCLLLKYTLLMSNWFLEALRKCGVTGNVEEWKLIKKVDEMVPSVCTMSNSISSSATFRDTKSYESVMERSHLSFSTYVKLFLCNVSLVMFI